MMSILLSNCDGRTYEWMDGRTDRRTDGHTKPHLELNVESKKIFDVTAEGPLTKTA